MEVDGQRHASAALPTEKTRYSLYRRLGGPKGRCGWVMNISPPPHGNWIPGLSRDFARRTINSALRAMNYLHLQRVGTFTGIQNFGKVCEMEEPTEAEKILKSSSSSSSCS